MDGYEAFMWFTVGIFVGTATLALALGIVKGGQDD